MSPGVVASVTLSTRVGIKRGSGSAVGSDGVTIGSPEAVLSGAGVEGLVVLLASFVFALMALWNDLGWCQFGIRDIALGQVGRRDGVPGVGFREGEFLRHAFFTVAEALEVL
eukprot:scaffold357004_cov37-Attheya_sp.AAC.1